MARQRQLHTAFVEAPLLPMRERRARRPKTQLPASYTLVCQHCHKDYVPVKRGTQKFCSSSCRSTHSKQRKAGTLGRITSLLGPARTGLGFWEASAAAGVGAAGVTAVEYVLVTRHLVADSQQHSQQLTALTEMMQQLQAQNVYLLAQVQQLSQALGVAPVAGASVPPKPMVGAPLDPQEPPLQEPISDQALTVEEQHIYDQLVAALTPSPQPEPSVRTTQASRRTKKAEQ